MEKVSQNAQKSDAKSNATVNTAFFGSYKYNVDSKKRVCFPPDYVKILDTMYKDENRTLIVGLCLNGTVGVYPVKNYKAFLDQFKKEPVLDQNMMDLLNVVQGCTTVQTLDSQKRFRLSDELCGYAGITKEVYLKGFDDHVEVWDKERWENYAKTTIPRLRDIANQAHKSSKKE